jgi:hypothetical protein
LRKKPSRRKHLRPKRFILKPGIFPGEYFVQIGGTENEALAWWTDKIGANYLPYEDSPRSASFMHGDFPGGLIWLSNGKCAGAVAHECLHAVFHTMRCIGMGTEPASEEVFCYMLDWLTEKLTARASER